MWFRTWDEAGFKSFLTLTHLYVLCTVQVEHVNIINTHQHIVDPWRWGGGVYRVTWTWNRMKNGNLSYLSGKTCCTDCSSLKLHIYMCTTRKIFNSLSLVGSLNNNFHILLFPYCQLLYIRSGCWRSRSSCDFLSAPQKTGQRDRLHPGPKYPDGQEKGLCNSSDWSQDDRGSLPVKLQPNRPQEWHLKETRGIQVGLSCVWT